MIITSAANPRVKAWSALLTKRGRDEQGAFLLEGVHLTQEALRSQAKVQTILYNMDRELPGELEHYRSAGAMAEQSGNVEWVGVSETVLAKCTETKTPQGVVAVCAKPDYEAAAFLESKQALVVAVDGVQDPGNLGTIIRTADAAGATGVLLGRGTVDLYNPKTVRSTMGSLFHLPIAECDLKELLLAAGRQGIRLVGTRLDARRHCYELDLRQSVWFLVGNEGSGLSPELAAYVNEDIIIPMPGQAESLNVAMATGILLYEAVRQRHFSK
ncbi:RNA methyltransferase [Paenibacillus sp. YN15]|uniref:TrmH family RNA methyltransferase n=1 Tax=Paenibacillus sp. YN15 TaxID=1742774 RepID=UPI000DCAFE0B|nr:RNA methyltransferase [Paenibacillus sp. YN15]RAU95298.1 RNA methyltransferase [Paenibacillus sp. YN15]